MFSYLKFPRDEFEKIVRMLRNPNAPKAPRIVVGLLFLYIIWPLDVLPDFIVPLFGWFDDAALAALTLWWLRKETERLSR